MNSKTQGLTSYTKYIRIEMKNREVLVTFSGKVFTRAFANFLERSFSKNLSCSIYVVRPTTVFQCFHWKAFTVEAVTTESKPRWIQRIHCVHWPTTHSLTVGEVEGVFTPPELERTCIERIISNSGEVMMNNKKSHSRSQYRSPYHAKGITLMRRGREVSIPLYSAGVAKAAGARLL